jgi:hypothetical protein
MKMGKNSFIKKKKNRRRRQQQQQQQSIAHIWGRRKPDAIRKSGKSNGKREFCSLLKFKF